MVAGPLAGPATALCPSDPEPAKVTLHTEDKLSLTATYFAPRDSKQKAPGALLVHGAGGTRADLQPLAQRLQKAGFAVLALDLRGHGDSASAELDWKKLDKEAQTRNWAFMSRDVKAGVEYLTSQSGVHTMTVSLVGYGAGCTLVARHATRDEKVRDIVLLSPVTEQLGSSLLKDLAELSGLPIYVAVGKDEAATAKSVTEAATRGSTEESEVMANVLKVNAAELLGDAKLPVDLGRWMQAKALPSAAKPPDAKPARGGK
ncbi:MAG: alpha/beta fold hydrolase [Planctomycetota bacterium]